MISKNDTNAVTSFFMHIRCIILRQFRNMKHFLTLKAGSSRIPFRYITQSLRFYCVKCFGVSVTEP